MFLGCKLLIIDLVSNFCRSELYMVEISKVQIKSRPKFRSTRKFRTTELIEKMFPIYMNETWNKYDVNKFKKILSD